MKLRKDNIGEPKHVHHHSDAAATAADDDSDDEDDDDGSGDRDGFQSDRM